MFVLIMFSQVATRCKIADKSVEAARA